MAKRYELVQHYEGFGRLFHTLRAEERPEEGRSPAVGPDISSLEVRYVIDVYQEMIDTRPPEEVPGLKRLEGRILDVDHDVLSDLQLKELTLRLHDDRLELRLQLQPDGRIIPRSALTDVAPG